MRAAKAAYLACEPRTKWIVTGMAASTPVTWVVVAMSRPPLLVSLPV